MIWWRERKTIRSWGRMCKSEHEDEDEERSRNHIVLDTEKMQEIRLKLSFVEGCFLRWEYSVFEDMTDFRPDRVLL